MDYCIAEGGVPVCDVQEDPDGDWVRHEDVAELLAGYRRYEVVRRMSVVQFAALFEYSLRTGKPFDETLDDLRPFFLSLDAD